MAKGANIWHEGEHIGWDQLCFVRAIKNPAEQLCVENGKVISLSAINSSKGEIPRLTVHGALNHLVKSNFGGFWEDSALIIISPMDKIIDINGKPENLNAVDTFWSRDVVIPEGSVFLWIEKKFILAESNLPGITQEVIEIPDQLIKEIEDDRNNGGGGDGLVPLWRSKVQEILSAEINSRISVMGYEVFQGDHGNYMEGPMADSIYELAVKEKITSQTHVNTLLGAMELGDGWFCQPLMQLSRESNEEIFRIKEDGKTDFWEILEEANRVLIDNEVANRNLSAAEIRQLLIFSGELFKRINENIEVLSNKEIRMSLSNLFANCSIIRENMQEWSKKIPELMEIIEKNNDEK